MMCVSTHRGVKAPPSRLWFAKGRTRREIASTVVSPIFAVDDQSPILVLPRFEVDACWGSR